MADLRKAAREWECQGKNLGVCNGNSETSVLRAGAYPAGWIVRYRYQAARPD